MIILPNDLEDKASSMYKQENKSMDLGRNVDQVTMWGFGSSIGALMLISVPILNTLLALAGAILGIIGAVRISKDETLKGMGFAIAAIVIGAVFFIISLFILLAFFASFAI